MAWLELKIALGSLDAERVEQALEEAGALSVTLVGEPHAASGDTHALA